MSRFSLFAELKAKPGKEEDLAKFLASAQALAEAEPGTTAWFAVRFDESTSQCLILSIPRADARRT